MELTVYDRQSDPSQGVKDLATAIAKSQMFNCTNDAQAYVLAMECFVRRISPIELSTKYHLIKGKLSVKASVMLADATKYGWTHQVLSRTSELAAIRLMRGDEAVDVSLSWEQAQAEPFPYEGKEEDILKQFAAGKKPPLKPKYSTPRSRSQMLWARVVTDAITACCPQAASGCQAPEIVEDYQEEPITAPEPKRRTRVVAEPVAAIDATPRPAIAAPVANSDELPASITDQQVREIQSLAMICGLRNLTDMIREAGAERIEGLSRKAATQIATKLHEMRAAQIDSTREVAAERAAIQSVEAGDVIDAEFQFSADDDEPAAADQVAEIKQVIQELAQSPDHSDIVANVREQLGKIGVAKLADLSRGNARSLLVALQGKQLHLWADKLLSKDLS